MKALFSATSLRPLCDECLEVGKSFHLAVEEGIDNPYVSWTGIAVETPEPSSWLFFSSALFIILVLKWKALLV